MIITPKAQIGDIDSLLLRNQINSLFKDAKLTIVVNRVKKSKTGQNIVLTTSPDNTAEDLLNNKSIWEHLFDPRTVRKDESWFKVVAHGVNIYTIDRLLIQLQPKSTDQFVICGNFNPHHNWWNSKIQQAIRSENLVKWLKLNRCSLINTPDLCTYYAHSGSSSSVIDLTFANSKIENAITNWSIDENADTGSDHEVIRFELIASFKNLTSHATALSNKYNCNKADWNKFAKYLDENSTIYESQVQSLLNNHQFDELAIYLQNVIKNAAEMFIPKTKICAKSKKWWSQDLTELRKTMCRHRREWKNYPSDFIHRMFKHSRIEYFHAIRKAKQQTWLTFRENAANKDVFTSDTAIFDLIYSD